MRDLKTDELATVSGGWFQDNPPENPHDNPNERPHPPENPFPDSPFPEDELRLPPVIVTGVPGGDENEEDEAPSEDEQFPPWPDGFLCC